MLRLIFYPKYLIRICAAASIETNQLVSEEGFHVLYKGKSCTYSEYKDAVRRALKRYLAYEEQIPDLISRHAAEAVLTATTKGFLSA